MKDLRFIITILILSAAIGVSQYLSRPDISIPRKSLDEFPRVVAGWTAVNDYRIDEGSLKILQVDDYIMRNYRNTKGELIGLYIGYFKSQREGKGIHSPRQCLPGSGWIPLSTSIYNVRLSGNDSRIFPVNQFIVEKAGEKHLFLFWYYGRHRIYASEYQNKMYLIWDAMTKRRTDGALIRVHSPIMGSVKEPLELQEEFIRNILPLADEFIPN